MGLLEGKVAVITGAGNGIGREEALLFGREGARVVVNDVGGARDGTGGAESAADAVVAELRAAGVEAVASYASVVTMEGAKQIVATAVEAFGGVDVVVNNAGILRDRSFLKMDEPLFDLVLAVHLKGTFNVSWWAAQRMVEQKRGGKIVNTTSVSGLFGNFGQANYSAAKAGIYGLTRTLAIELKKHDVQVNALAPIARTRMTEDLPMFMALGEDTMGPKFIAPAALFLGSSLSGDLTGEVLGVAGTRVSTYRVQESQGLVGEDPGRPWTAEELRARWDELSKY